MVVAMFRISVLRDTEVISLRKYKIYFYEVLYSVWFNNCVIHRKFQKKQSKVKGGN